MASHISHQQRLNKLLFFWGVGVGWGGRVVVGWGWGWGIVWSVLRSVCVIMCESSVTHAGGREVEKHNHAQPYSSKVKAWYVVFHPKPAASQATF